MDNLLRSRALALAAWVALAVAAGCAPPSRTLVTVGGEPITVAEFEDVARRSPQLALDPSPQAKRSLLDQLVDRRLLLQEARRRGLADTAALARVRAAGEQEILPELLYRRVVGSRVSVSEAEVKAVWDRLDREMRLAQIFTFTQPEAEQVLRRLGAGQPFEAVARSHSRDRASAMTGGDMGYLTAGQLPGAIERAVRDLPQGRWTAPVATPVGYYIVKVVERRPRQREPYNEVRAAIESILRQRKERSLVLAYVAGLKQRYDMRLDERGLDLVARKLQNRPPAELFATGADPRRLGFTAAELAQPLVRFEGGAYTVADLFRDLTETSSMDRPPLADDGALRFFLEDRATFRLLLREARDRGLHREPIYAQRLREREESYLMNALYEKVIVPASQVTEEERERLRAQAGNTKGIPPELAAVLGDQEAQFFQRKREQTLQDLMVRLRKEHPPHVNEKVLADVPWPVPPKENA